MTRAPHLTLAMAKDSNAAQRRSNKARQQAKGKKVQANAPKKEPKTSELETSTAPPNLDKQDAPTQLVLEQTLHEQEDQIAALRQKNEALQNELKETQHTLQESHRAFADQMVGLSASFDQDKEEACKQVRTELDQVRAELNVSRYKERALTEQLHELENKIQIDASAALSPFTALKDIQAQLHDVVAHASNPPNESFASIAESFGYTQDSEYTFVEKLHAAHHAKYTNLYLATKQGFQALTNEFTRTLTQMEQALKDTTPDKMESVLRSVRDYQARLMQECRHFIGPESR